MTSCGLRIILALVENKDHPPHLATTKPKRLMLSGALLYAPQISAT